MGTIVIIFITKLSTLWICIKEVFVDKRIDYLKDLLLKVADSYYAFVVGTLVYAKKKQSRLEAVIAYLENNPDAMSSDVVGFISDQPDFYEDAVPEKVG